MGICFGKDKELIPLDDLSVSNSCDVKSVMNVKAGPEVSLKSALNSVSASEVASEVAPKSALKSVSALKSAPKAGVDLIEADMLIEKLVCS